MTKDGPHANRLSVQAIAVLSLVAFPAWVNAAVTDSNANGFTVRLTLTIQAPPERVYGSLIHDVGEWWASDHTFSGDAHNLSIEEKPMGCFCEKLSGNGGVRHMEVVNFSPGKTLVMIGGLGPLQSLATSGTMTVRLAPAGTGTQIDITYSVAGYLPGGMNSLAAPVDAVTTQQFTRLKNYVEHGNAAPK